jgi:putative acetyltransferase
MKIALESPLQPEAVALVAEHDEEPAEHRPLERRQALGMATLAQANVLFAIARLDGRAVGCAALVLQRRHAELKRLYVRPARRGHGVARALLHFLEAELALRGCTLLKLETGTARPQAIDHYRALGFVPCARFGDHGPGPLSLFMEKALNAETADGSPPLARPGLAAYTSNLNT